MSSLEIILFKVQLDGEEGMCLKLAMRGHWNGVGKWHDQLTVFD